MSDQTSHYDCSDTHPACRILRSASQESGVTDPGNLPFMLCPQQATTAALLVHGFTGTPWEMRPLADFLADAGIASLSVRLPGHGTTPEDLAGRRWQEWLDSVDQGYRVLNEEFTSVFGMGMSTGCLLLLATSGEPNASAAWCFFLLTCAFVINWHLMPDGCGGSDPYYLKQPEKSSRSVITTANRLPAFTRSTC